MRRLVVSVLVVCPIWAASACGDNGDPSLAAMTPDASPVGDAPTNPAREQYGSWIKIEPPGAVCGNGSQYKFFVNFSKASDNLVVVFEPGGACWDYESCTGKNGVRGAANVNGIGDDHWTFGELVSPFLQRVDSRVPSHDWNQVWVPYCTGDVHTGNRIITYSDPDGVEPDIEFHHAGHNNVHQVVTWIDANFTHVPKMLVTGCSAGGAGAITNYYFLRSGVRAAQRGYLLDDSGPIFPSTGFSAPLHRKIRDSWAIDSILVGLPDGFDRENFGSINGALASFFPDDRLATTYFRRDWNYSLYSYERFYDLPPPADPAFKTEVMRMWDADTALLTGVYDAHDNLAYYIPYWRELNDSHCTTLLGFEGSEIEDAHMQLFDWVSDLVDDQVVLKSALEAPVAGEDE